MEKFAVVDTLFQIEMTLGVDLKDHPVTDIARHRPKSLSCRVFESGESTLLYQINVTTVCISVTILISSPGRLLER